MAPMRRRRWILPLVLLAVAASGVGVGIALARRGDTGDAGSSAQARRSQLADIDRACTTWMSSQTGSGPVTGTWCQDMTGWMNGQISDGSAAGSMMWGDADHMLAACRSWMSADPSGERPSDWCDSLLRGISPHMDGDWDDATSGPMMGG